MKTAKTQSKSSVLNQIYRVLFKAFGEQQWWPGETRFEVIVGAILTQNTNWGNVEKALISLKEAKLLNPQAMHNASMARIAVLIRPSGYFNVKAKRLKNFLKFLFTEYGGSLAKMAKEPLEILRHKLLSVNGIGPETADSIILYAFNKPSFVIDAYTKRMLVRHNFIPPDAGYHFIKEMFEKNMKSDPQIFNEYHALIVRLGKEFCKTKAACNGCPLNQEKFFLK